MKLSLYALLFALMLLTACNTTVSKLETESEVIRDQHFSLARLPFERLYKNQATLYNTMNCGLHDQDGVLLFTYQDSTYYHPVDICHSSLEALNDYYISNNPVYLNYATVNLEKIRSLATRHENMLYFKYDFTYDASDQVVYTAPWYSGMAQGMALSAYSRLYYFTKNPLYQSVADSILATMTDFDSSFQCVLISDAEGLLKEENYYWIDEYPHHIKRYVLNGSIIGSMGLYDHWWVFRDEASKVWFSRAMTTYKDKVLLFRNPGDMSAYCLKFREKIPLYHELHQYLLDLCSATTNDPLYEAISDLFQADYSRGM